LYTRTRNSESQKNVRGDTANRNRNTTIAKLIPNPTSGSSQDSKLPNSVRWMRDQLDELVRHADALGLPEHEAVSAVLGWAAEHSYATGGYQHIRAVILDALETVLIRDIKN
jgi:hypothetical protein